MSGCGTGATELASELACRRAIVLGRWLQYDDGGFGKVSASDKSKSGIRKEKGPQESALLVAVVPR